MTDIETELAALRQKAKTRLEAINGDIAKLKTDIDSLEDERARILEAFPPEKAPRKKSDKPRATQKKVLELDDKVKAYVADHPTATPAVVSDAVGASISQTRRSMARLAK